MFYVYEWFKNDNLEVFHVGKGKGKRRFSMSGRNRYFKNIISKYDCSVRIYKLCNSEEDAWEIEQERIAELKLIGQAQTNFHVGGSGGDTWSHRSEESRQDQIMRWRESFDGSGENNNFFGRKHTDETKKILSEKAKERIKNNPNLNPMLNKRHSDVSKMKMSLNSKGKNSGKDSVFSKPCKFILKDVTMNFYSVKECIKYLSEKYNVSIALLEKIYKSKEPYVLKKVHSKDKERLSKIIGLQIISLERATTIEKVSQEKNL